MPHGDSPDQLSLAEPMHSRWSTRFFDDQHELSDDELELLLHAAQWAPSWGNLQPWAFVVIRRGGPAHTGLMQRLSRGNSTWVPRASAVLVASAQIAPDPSDDLDDPAFKGEPHARYDLGQAVAHLTLQATAMSLHAHQFAGLDREAAGRDLGVPAHFEVMTGIAIGRAGDPAAAPEGLAKRESRPRTRKALAEFAYADGWTHAWTRSER